MLEVDYLDERKFAEKAAARARAGSAIVQQTYRAAYTADPDGQWQGYTDVDAARAWGVKEWGKRAGQGAYFDWLAANALLPAEAPDRASGQPAENLEKLDRTSVAAVAEIASALSEIQSVLDDATLGVTPVGVGEDAVPFDIDPARLDRGSANTATHFQQIYERAATALKNAVTAFDYANEADQRLRQVATTTQELTDRALDQDTAFRNRLKKVFGSPYAGTIGSGKLYPAGYQGPDLFLWQYVDRTTAAQYVPPESGAYQGIFTTPPNYEVTMIPKGFQTLYSLETTAYTLADFFNTYLERSYNDIVNDNGAVDAVHVQGTDYRSLFADYPLPFAHDATYGFQASPDWGSRAVTGEIQSQIAKTIAAQIGVQKATDDYQAYLRELRTDLDVLFSKQEFLRSQTASANGLVAAQKVVQTLFLSADIGKKANEIVEASTFNLSNAVAEALPKVVGTSNDVTAPARAAILASLAASQAAFDGTQVGFDITKSLTEFAFDITKANFEIYDEGLKRTEDLIGATKSVQEKVNGESTMRFAIGSALNKLTQEEQALSRMIDEGSALLDERQTSNERLAAAVQKERYNDVTLRVAHNDALQKYRDAFENAAKYTYLAAKAYAYETNLSDNHPANATGILTEIVGARLPGHVENGTPQINGGGLSAILAKLKGNYDNLNGQLGFNNPQTETGKFSLRRELFRVKKPAATDNSTAAIVSNQRWRHVLGDRYVGNLWNVPEFRTYCRPPWTEAEGAQPGLVIPFESSIFEGKNFFGWPLAGGDQAYDASLFSTKIRSVGVWFEGYDGQNLAVAPRVYLVPAGTDIMRIANSTNLATRAWSVVDQAIPTPYAINQPDLANDNFIPGISNLTEPFGAIRKFSRFRAYHDDGSDFFNDSELSWDSRLVGRSVWNTKWLLIIPGSTLSADGVAGLQKLIGSDNAPGIRDIRLIFKTYSASGN